MGIIYPCPFNKYVECTKQPGPGRCTTCGFNPYENQYRIGLAAGGAMKIDSDGLKRLHIKRDEN